VKLLIVDARKLGSMISRVQCEFTDEVISRIADTVATLRDTLLPRLISGQLRLPEAQPAADDALV